MARAAPAAPTWQMPICVKTPARRRRACQVVDGPTRDDRRSTPTRCVPWVFVNAGAHGLLPHRLFARRCSRAIAPDLATRLTAAERLSLVGDEWALVRAGRHTVADYLTLASGFGDERVSGVLGEVATPADVHRTTT